MTRPVRQAPAADRSATWRQSEEQLATRVVALQLSASEVLGSEPSRAVRNRVLAGDLGGAVEALTWECISRSTSGEPLDELLSARVHDLLVALQHLGNAIFEHELGLLSRRLADCDAATARLRALTTSNDLLDHVCEELVLRCGFGRAVLSRVDGAMWKPWMAHFGAGENSDDEEWFEAWVDRPIPLEGMLLESRILQERRPAAVYDTQEADVHKPIIVDAGQSVSYVVAPLVVGDAVIGFLHADYSTTGRRVDSVDRDVLWAFAQCFAQLYERAVLRERLLEQRERVRQVLAASDDLLADRGCELVLNGGAPPSSPTATRTVPTFGPGDALEQLTVREREVLALVAVGATNQQIADQLVVAESTVKTHVKHILRKLGVANRAQAIAQFLRV
ncbi:MAG: LuxR family transcriptional regulator [Frankiales bacterium]|nr:LuxR family transcriptional regulator [Frankiales bacterium]